MIYSDTAPQTPDNVWEDTLHTNNWGASWDSQIVIQLVHAQKISDAVWNAIDIKNGIWYERPVLISSPQNWFDCYLAEVGVSDTVDTLTARVKQALNFRTPEERAAKEEKLARAENENREKCARLATALSELDMSDPIEVANYIISFAETFPDGDDSFESFDLIMNIRETLQNTWYWTTHYWNIVPLNPSIEELSDFIIYHTIQGTPFRFQNLRKIFEETKEKAK